MNQNQTIKQRAEKVVLISGLAINNHYVTFQKSLKACWVQSSYANEGLDWIYVFFVVVAVVVVAFGDGGVT